MEASDGLRYYLGAQDTLPQAFALELAHFVSVMSALFQKVLR